MRHAARILVLAGALLALPASAHAAPRVHVMVVGKSRVLEAPRSVALHARSARVAGRRCAVPAASPLSALLGTGLRLSLRDYARCSARTADAAGLYVAKIGPDRASGRNGWVYKVGHVTGSAGAADPYGVHLRRGASLLWFWCRASARGGCQRTLGVSAPGRVAHGGSLEVTVRGYDDQGRGRAIAGATVRLGHAHAITDAHGVARVAAPGSRGRARLYATRTGLVRSFTKEIAVS